MKNVLYFLSAASFILLLVVSCSKEKKVERRIPGEYELEVYTVNGVDSLAQINDSIFNCDDYYFIFIAANSKTLPNGIQIIGRGNCGVFGNELGSGDWYLENEATILDLGISVFTDSIYRVRVNELTGDWNIIQINPDIQLQRVNNGRNYELIFKSRE